MMRMLCPHCGVKGTTDDALLYKKVKCPKCNTVFIAKEVGAAAAHVIDERLGNSILEGSAFDGSLGGTASPGGDMSVELMDESEINRLLSGHMGEDDDVVAALSDVESDDEEWDNFQREGVSDEIAILSGDDADVPSDLEQLLAPFAESAESESDADVLHQDIEALLLQEERESLAEISGVGEDEAELEVLQLIETTEAGADLSEEIPPEDPKVVDDEDEDLSMSDDPTSEDPFGAAADVLVEEDDEYEPEELNSAEDMPVVPEGEDNLLTKEERENFIEESSFLDDEDDEDDEEEVDWLVDEADEADEEDEEDEAEGLTIIDTADFSERSEGMDVSEEETAEEVEGPDDSTEDLEDTALDSEGEEESHEIYVPSNKEVEKLWGDSSQNKDEKEFGGSEKCAACEEYIEPETGYKLGSNTYCDKCVPRRRVIEEEEDPSAEKATTDEGKKTGFFRRFFSKKHRKNTDT